MFQQHPKFNYHIPTELVNSRLYFLPKVLLDIIWSYDDRYKLQFKTCMYNLMHYFNHSRVLCRLTSEKHLFDVCMDIQKTRPVCYRCYSDFYAYILTRISRYGDHMNNDNLISNRLKRLSTAQINT